MEIGNNEIIAAIVTLSGALAFLFRLLHNDKQETREELRDLREKRETDTNEIKELNRHVGELSGKQQGYRLGVEHLSAQVIAEVRSLKEE